MATSVAEDGAPPSLSQLFLQGWEARRKIDACELASGSAEHSKCVSDGVTVLERATEMANEMSLFSDNEDVEEVATSSLKYLLLPVVLGELTLQQNSGERMGIVRRARVYFVDYLRRCRSYGITKDDPPLLALPQDPAPQGAPAGRRAQKSYDQLAAERTAKIQRLREKKELERRTEELTAALSGREREIEDDEGREQWVAMLKLEVYRSQDFVTSIDEEIHLLQHMQAMRGREGPVAKKPEGASGFGPAAPRKPLVITREMIRGQVFGAGYPSLPTMTVEEFYQQQYGEGKVEVGGGGKTEEEGEQEEEEEEESEADLKKARDWDDFKDDNRRGWGNRRNMG